MTFYTLSVVMEALGQSAPGGMNVMGFGFGGTVGSGASILLDNNGLASALNTATIGTVPGGISGLFRIELTTGATTLTSTANYFRNGVQFGPVNAVINTSSTDRKSVV